MSMLRKAKQDDILKIAPGIFLRASAIEDFRPAFDEIKGATNLFPPEGRGDMTGSAMQRGSTTLPETKPVPGFAPMHLAITI